MFTLQSVQGHTGLTNRAPECPNVKK